MTNERDEDFDDFLSEQLHDPAVRAAYDDAEQRSLLVRELIARRQDLQLSQAEVAARMGIGQSTVSEFEGAVGDPRLSTLQRYARAVEGSIRIRFEPAYTQREPLLIGTGFAIGSFTHSTFAYPIVDFRPPPFDELAPNPLALKATA